MRGSIVIAALLFAVLLAAGEGRSWRLVEKGARHLIHARDDEKAGVRELKVAAIIEGTVAEAVAIAADVEGMPRHNKVLKEARVIERQGDCELAYYRLSPPVVDDRDYLLRSCTERSSDGQYAKILWRAVEDDRFPILPGVVRVIENRGYYTFSQRDEKHIEMVYFIHADPGGMLPAFIVRSVQLDAVKEVVFSMEERIAKARKAVAKR